MAMLAVMLIVQKVIMMSNQNSILKTQIPLNYYFIFSATAGCLLLIFPAPLFKTVFYEVLIFFYLYFFLGRNACRIVLTDTELRIKYCFFWEKDITVNLGDIAEIDYERGFYDLFSDKTRGGLFVFPKYCSDRLILKMKNNYSIGVMLININTRAFQFDIILKKLRLRIVEIKNSTKP